MPTIINENDSEALVRVRIIEILQFQNIETDDITSWGTASNKLNLAASRLGLEQLSNEMAGGEARARINAIASSVAAEFPSNTTLPVISGTPEYNQILTATAGTWVGYPAPTYTYQWKADGVNISGATSNQYTLSDLDLGKEITVQVTGTNLSGFASVTSEATAVVTSTPINSLVPNISGTVANGQILTASNGSWIAFPVPTYTYQWKAAGVNISGATNQTYTLQNSDIGKAMTVEVTATNSEGNSSSLSAATTLVTGAPINTVLPVFAAEAVAGTTISTTNGTWLGYPAITYTYQWKRNGVNISGATNSSYSVVSGDIGADISVTVTATNSVSAVPATSVVKMAKPDWAATFDVWRDFTTNLGDLENPTDIHAAAINAANAAGAYSSFAPNVLVRTDLGVSTVPTRSNSINNSAFSGASVGTIGSGGSIGVQNSISANINANILEIGIENGLPFIEIEASYNNISGSIQYPNIAFTSPVLAPTLGNSVVFSIFHRNIIPATGIQGRMQITHNKSDGVSYPIFPLPTTVNPMARLENIVAGQTTTTNIGQCRIQWDVPNGSSFYVRMRLYCPQFELGQFVSPPILTTGSTSTVAGNQPRLSTLDSARSFILDIDVLGRPNALIYILNTLGANDNRYSLVINPAGAFSLDVGRNGYLGGIIGGQVNIGRNVIYGVMAPNFVRHGLVGGTSSLARTDLAGPIGLNTIYLGTQGGSGGQGYTRTRKLTIDYLAPGDDPAAAFANAYAKAQLAAAAP